MPLNNKNSIDYWGNNNPKCPHCDETIDVSEHELWDLYQEPDGSHDIECPYCQKELRVQSNCKWTFSTDEQD